jgi:hypothetical protein
MCTVRVCVCVCARVRELTNPRSTLLLFTMFALCWQITNTAATQAARFRAMSMTTTNTFRVRSSRFRDPAMVTPDGTVSLALLRHTQRSGMVAVYLRFRATVGTKV